MPTDHISEESTYVIDSESAAEMARLTYQDHLLTEHLKGLSLEHTDLSNVKEVLDIACGPGGWVLDMAHAYPRMHVIGIDMSKQMIQYARANARVQGLENADFRTMDALKPLDFPDGSFDFINARLLFGFMPAKAWPRLLQECKRILRPGGLIRLTEGEVGISNGPATEQLSGMFTLAMQRAGMSFSPDGRHIGITPMLGRLLENAGFQNIQKVAHVLDYSAGRPAHHSFVQNMLVGSKLAHPFFIKLGVTTQEEVDRLYELSRQEMYSDDFCGIWFFLTVWGTQL